MESVVFFGKGGIGKSTIASNITVILAAGGRKVLHVGCDPKTDSTLPLMGKHIPPFTSRSGSDPGACLRESIYPSAVKGVHCLEAGGPQPGVGCAGTGIGSMLDAMKDGGVLERDGYDAAVFDVLGDVVCGGFAAPLRRGFAKKAVIITSEELLSIYAANRLITMINNYSRNGVYLAGLVVNARNPGGARKAEEFARAAGTRVLGLLPRDPAVTAAEREHRPAVLAYPKSGFTRCAVRLCAAIKAAGAPKIPPRAMTDTEFFSFMEGGKSRSPGRPCAASRKGGPAVRSRGSVVSLFEAAGFKPAGMEHGQIICEWTSSKGVFKTLIAPASAEHEGMPGFSDWVVCFHPSSGGESGAFGGELLASAGRLAALKFDEMLGAFTGTGDLYGGLKAILNIPENTALPANYSYNQPHVGFHETRFFFPGGGREASAAPGSVMVEYGDSECRFCACEGGALGVFSEDFGVKYAESRARGPVLPNSARNIVNTDFNVQDAVFGGGEKMLESMRKAADQAGRGGLVEFYTTCSPMLLAGDPGSFARRVEREKGVKLLLEDHNNFTEDNPAKSEVRSEFMAKRLLCRGVKKTRDANLVDFGGGAAELAALLDSRGITAGMPGEDFYGAAREARLQVLSGRDAVLGSAFAKAGLKHVLPPAPFGFAGTEAWLEAIFRALSRKTAAGPSPAERRQARELWDRARGYAAGFVLEAGEIALLAENSAFKMVPVLPVLAEAGFKLILFIKADGRVAPGAGGRAGTQIKMALRETAALKTALPGCRLTAKFFGTPQELRALFRADPGLRLVYSQVRRDARVVSAGRNPFSASLFKPGYAGALETWRRLVELCEWDFNERYLLSK